MPEEAGLPEEALLEIAGDGPEFRLAKKRLWTRSETGPQALPAVLPPIDE
ncbi:hypothetical protein GCM10009839_06200 [Catenulispora yoronensis]|uniref:Uncharacterized protein n=1 Tax=Catenulispora yoronensis TaxID=450799 RepID=A0ABP5F444_9ACTN